MNTSTNVTTRLLRDEEGMATLEYALLAVTALALATALYLVVSSGMVQDALQGLVTDTLNNRPGV